MNDIERYQGEGLGNGINRHVGRTIARIEAGASVRLSRLETAAELQTATVDAVSYVGRRALQDVALLSQVEQQLAITVPLASGRLAAIADLTAIALSEVVAETASKLRRA